MIGTGRELKMICENAAINGRGISVAQCWSNSATHITTVHYNDVESDTAKLCSECSQALTKDARKHGYKVHSESVKP